MTDKYFYTGCPEFKVQREFVVNMKLANGLNAHRATTKPFPVRPFFAFAESIFFKF